MPGYELERFIDLSESEKTEMICSICHDIFKNPLVTNCCLQAFCEDCINEWLNTNNICPYDRKDLNVDQLTRPPRMLVNMLGKLKIYCTYKENGCEEIVLLDNLNNHVKSCRFDKKICNECKFEILDEHNCIKNLQQTIEIFEAKLASMKIENQNNLQTIQDLSNNSPLNMNNNLKILVNQMLNYAREHPDSLKVFYTGSLTHIADSIIAIVKEAITKERELIKICNSIRISLQFELGGLWQCVVYYHNTGDYSSVIDKDYRVNFLIGKLLMTVNKVYDETNFLKIAHRLCSDESKDEFKILKTDMNKDSIVKIKGLVMSEFKKRLNWDDFTAQLIIELKNTFGGIWNCVIYKQNLGHLYIRSKTGRHIHFNVLDIELTIFQMPNLNFLE